MSQLKPVRGTHDLLPEEQRKHRHILETAREIAERYGCEEMSTPIFESLDVFQRTLGEASDIVNKEMYTFPDRGGDLLTLRPEGTAAIARAFISNGLSHRTPVKFFYQGPMFRYERPQKGRTRQFHQFGVEILGTSHPMADIEVISMGQLILNELGLKASTSLEINSIGDRASRTAYRQALVDYLSQYKSDLSEDSQRRLESNPLRILDSKNDQDKKITATAPVITDYLNPESTAVFEAILEGLTDLEVIYKVNPHLVRGLDYYNHCVFEFRSQDLGAQDAVLSGGRYDELVKTMGGPDTPGMGWAAGVERLSLLLKSLPQPRRPIALVPLGEKAEKAVLQLAHTLRTNGLVVEVGYSGNLSKRMKKANKLNASAAVILGDDELAKGEATVKDLDTGAQVQMKIESLPTRLKQFP